MELNDNVHASVMNRFDGFTGLRDVAEVVIHDCQVVRAESVHFPRLVQEQAASKVNTLDTQSLEIVKGVDDSLKVTTMAELVSSGILLPCGAVGIVVCGIAVCESVEEETVKWESPICGTFCVVVLSGP